MLFFIIIGHLVAPGNQAIADDLIPEAKLLAKGHPSIKIRKVKGKAFIRPARPFDHRGIGAIGLPIPWLLHNACRDGVPSQRPIPLQMRAQRLQMRLGKRLKPIILRHAVRILPEFNIKSVFLWSRLHHIEHLKR